MTLFLLAPIGLDRGFWRELDPGRVASVAHDLPGFGGRLPDPTRATMQDWTLDVTEAIERPDVGPVDLVGCSLGAMVAQNVALERPDLVRSMVLACTGPSADRDVMTQRAAHVEEVGMAGVLDETLDRWFASGTLAQDPEHPAVGYARSTLLALDAAAFADGWRVIGDHDVTGRLGEIGVPTTCVAALYDRAAPIPRMTLLSEGIRGARLVTIDGAHMAPLEDGPGFSAIVQAHLAALDVWMSPGPKEGSVA